MDAQSLSGHHPWLGDGGVWVHQGLKAPASPWRSHIGSTGHFKRESVMYLVLNKCVVYFAFL